MVDVPVRFVVSGWTSGVGNEPLGDDVKFQLTSGVWHGGSTFHGVMTMREEDAMELSEADGLGAVPVVLVYAYTAGVLSNEPSV